MTHTLIQNSPISVNFVKDILLKQYLTRREVTFGIFEKSSHTKNPNLGEIESHKIFAKISGFPISKNLGKKNPEKSPGFWIRI